MSELLYEDDVTGLTMHVFTGPERKDGGERRRVQITRAKTDGPGLNQGRQFISLSKEEFFALCEGIDKFTTFKIEGS
jgi:hypothetical protein